MPLLRAATALHGALRRQELSRDKLKQMEWGSLMYGPWYLVSCGITFATYVATYILSDVNIYPLSLTGPPVTKLSANQTTSGFKLLLLANSAVILVYIAVDDRHTHFKSSCVCEDYCANPSKLINKVMHEDHRMHQHALACTYVRTHYMHVGSSRAGGRGFVAITYILGRGPGAAFTAFIQLRTLRSRRS